jgi:phytoene dehydrogenase-like protein
VRQGRVIVIGAGLAGLNAARVISRAGHHVEIVESSSRIGGRVASEIIDGFVCDRGFQVVNPAYSELRESGIVEELNIRSLPKGIRIIDQERSLLVGDLRSGVKYLRGDLSAKSGSITEKINFLRYLLSATDDVDFATALSGSPKLYDVVLAPFLTGVFLTSPDSISNRTARELIHWFIKGKPGLPYGGVSRLPELLSRGLTISLNIKVESISPNVVRTTSADEQCDALVLAADPRSAARILDIEEPEMARCVTWYHSAPEGTIDDRELRVSPNSPITNSVVLSNTAPEYSPSREQLISTTTLVNLNQEEVERELSKIWRCDVKKWRLVHRVVIEDALPIQRSNIEVLQPVALGDGIYLAGDWRALPAQQGALLSGRLAGQKVVSDLQGR